jgi:hypothetical protein
MTSLYGSEIDGHFSNLKCDVKELFPDTTYAYLAGFSRCAIRDIGMISVCSENKDSLRWQWLKPAARTNRRRR